MKTKNFTAIFLWTISKNEWCNSFEKLLSKRAKFKIQWKLSAAYQIRFGFTEHEKMRLDNFQRVFAKSKNSFSFSHFFIEFFPYLFPLKLVVFESRPASGMEIQKPTRWRGLQFSQILFFRVKKCKKWDSFHARKNWPCPGKCGNSKYFVWVLTSWIGEVLWRIINTF